VIKSAGQLRTLDLFLNFPIMDMNRNALWRRHADTPAKEKARMTAFWGDESWQDAAYRQEQWLWGPEVIKGTNVDVVKGFQERLKKVAGFEYVADPLPMRNNQGADVYYLFFASQKPVAAQIVQDIFEKYRERRG
jgi:three-Cys-motif partner protein